ncbi:MAG TPA: chemotaxis protein CheB, partial [Lacipirellulaceae bacterium]|nr:chemotaxis protein CheB [Lacipirellulaceae bacterium]
MSAPEDTPAGSNGRDEELPPIAPDFVEEELRLDNIVPTRGYQLTPLVGLGGSAGSIKALGEFFNAMPHESGMAFVVILHLSPTHESAMAELLARSTSMPVHQAGDGQEIEPNQVYVIPPGKYLTALDGRLKLTEMDDERGRRVAVDLFFRSLADSHGAHSAAIVLSGADGDGALGIKRIKERGGLTIAQEPEEAEYPSMPRTAIETGMVDWVLNISQMPARLIEYRKTAGRLALPSEEGPQPMLVRPVRSDASEGALRDVLSFLRTRTGRDFSYYKRATIVRRVGRRMQVNGLETLPDYLNYLRTHLGEAGALLQDLLISVTNFFRDRDAFEAIERCIPALFEGKTANDSVRVWVPACATGEEAYSFAMLLMEHAGKLEAPPALQVFGCDLDEDAIQFARTGRYPAAIAADVSEARLRHFFVKDHRGYRVRRELRGRVLFAAHDVLNDAPFSRTDLISCRN